MTITIRHSTEADVEQIKRIYEQESCYANTLQVPFPSEELWRNRLENLAPNIKSLVAVIDGAVVGQLGLEVNASPRRRHVATLGMGVDEHYRRKGVGQALMCAAINLAENWMAVTRIELEVYADNLSAISLYEKLGFQREGLAKAFAFKDGHYADVVYMARCKT
ncbi:GNAT family N-acetyltransferase [Parasalinivibrio latis]|uniref:GNAT family N-acetyltransferase n=1 Tax=Parasalinivibrio latis TaxID=2952610 RepID=UPI0030E12A1F